ncbi:MAG: hypothetical protein GX788_07645 [Lactobacillales bacterium]|nr:hypothetical protein [Lactobacillales bacterium]
MNKQKAVVAVNDLIQVYTEEGDYLIPNLYRVTHIDRRFPHTLYYEAQTLDEMQMEEMRSKQAYFRDAYF